MPLSRDLKVDDYDSHDTAYCSSTSHSMESDDVNESDDACLPYDGVVTDEALSDTLTRLREERDQRLSTRALRRRSAGCCVIVDDRHRACLGCSPFSLVTGCYLWIGCLLLSSLAYVEQGLLLSFLHLHLFILTRSITQPRSWRFTFGVLWSFYSYQ
eukprot:GHVH01003594.1.p1 GENE.GHVH01003594.1~~GHVH01003594.1.p1  ORF type:complete len:157 (+),score=14.21 GHVH01003594.1:89-559(+)